MEKVTRRVFLAATAAGIGGRLLRSIESNQSSPLPIGFSAVVPISLPSNGAVQEAAAGMLAAEARPYLKSTELIDVSEAALKETWQKHFEQTGKAALLNYPNWDALKRDKEGKITEPGIGRRLAIFANLYYKSEGEAGEDFDSYYKRFVDKLFTLSALVDLDPIVLAVSLKISAENILNGMNDDLRGQQEDVRITQIQDGVMPAMRSVGLQNLFLQLAGPTHSGEFFDGGIARLLNAADQLEGKDPSKRQASMPDGGMWYYDLIRLNGEDTIGMMDFQLSEHARSALDPTNQLLYEMLQWRYPTVAQRYQEIINTRKAVDEQKSRLQEIIDAYIAWSMFYESLSFDNFTNFTPPMLDATGLGSRFDPWQNTNYTETWLQNVQSPTNQDNDPNPIVEALRQQWQADNLRFYRKLVRNQILNPRFTAFLKKRALDNNMIYEADYIQKLEEARAAYEQQATMLRVAVLDTATDQGPLEYDSTFQILTSVMTTKRLSEQAGPFDPSDRDSLYWHIYKLIATREIAPPFILVDNESRIRDARIDAPYAPKEVLGNLETFTATLFQKGYLTQPSDKDLIQSIHAVERFRYGDRWRWPIEFADSDWTEMNTRFTHGLATRIYLNQDNSQWRELPPIFRSQELFDLFL